MTIDSHTHVFDCSVAGAEENFPLWAGTRWGASVPDLLRQIDEAGIDKAFIISYTPVDVMAHYPPDKQDYMVAVFQHYLTKDYFIRAWEGPPDRFVWFADSIDSRVPGYVERAAQDLDRGAAGLKLLPLFVDTEMDDPRWRPIFELLHERRRSCIIDLSWFAPSVHGKYASYTDYVHRLKQLAADFPTVRIQLAHYGTLRLQDRGDSSGGIQYAQLAEQIELIHSKATGLCLEAL